MLPSFQAVGHVERERDLYVPQSSHHMSETCAIIVTLNPKRKPIRASSGFLSLDNAVITKSWSSCWR